MIFEYEYTDTFAGDANYSWVKRGTIAVQELTHYGYDGLHGYGKAAAKQERQIVQKVKAALGLTGIPCRKESRGDTIALYPRGMCTVCFINYSETLN